MTRVFLGWGVLMGVIGLVGVLVFDLERPENGRLFAGVAAVMIGLAAVLAVTGRGRSLAGGMRALPDVSPPVPLLALAATFAAVGAILGLWLALIGAGLALVAIAGLVREARAQRRALRAAREREAG